MLRVFASGSCRLLGIVRSGHEMVEPIHSMNSGTHIDDGVNFIGKLHNVEQHIQFVQFITGNLFIPPHILRLCYLRSSTIFPLDDTEFNSRLLGLREQFVNCERYIFEICSLHIYEYRGYQVQHELLNEVSKKWIEAELIEYQQTSDELYSCLETLCKLLPQGKPIVFVCHFRHNIIHNDTTKTIQNREIIYETLCRLEKNYPNVYLYDPSLFLSKHREYYDNNNHYCDIYAKEIFTEMYRSLLKDPFHLKEKNSLS